MSRAFALGAGLLVTTAVAADRAADLARIHVEAMGGREPIAALAALRVTGTVVSAGQEVRFVLVAARPDRLRIETERGGRRLVQGTDGVEPAWELDDGVSPPVNRAMADGVARTFVGDAEFDDPLIAGTDRGFALDFAGEVQAGSGRQFRLLVTWRRSEPYSLLLDGSTYLIVMRTEQRATAIGRKVQVVTRYDDFRPVDGVLLPHAVTTSIEGRVTQQTKIERIEANPELNPDTFRRPKVGGAGAGAR